MEFFNREVDNKMNIIIRIVRNVDHSLTLNILFNLPHFAIQVTLHEFLRALKETLDLEKNQENIPVGEL